MGSFCGCCLSFSKQHVRYDLVRWWVSLAKYLFSYNWDKTQHQKLTFLVLVVLFMSDGSSTTSTPASSTVVKYHGSVASERTEKDLPSSFFFLVLKCVMLLPLIFSVAFQLWSWLEILVHGLVVLEGPMLVPVVAPPWCSSCCCCCFYQSKVLCELDRSWQLLCPLWHFITKQEIVLLNVCSFWHYTTHNMSGFSPCKWHYTVSHHASGITQHTGLWVYHHAKWFLSSLR